MIYIILPVHNRIKITQIALVKLKKQTYQTFRIILVDDGSTDNTSQMAKGIFPDIITLTGDGNLWWAGALQKARDFIKKNIHDAKKILIMNDDIDFDNRFLEIANNALEENKNSLICATERDSKGHHIISKGVSIDWRSFKFNYIPDTPTFCSTRAILLSMNNFIKLGGFYPKALPHYLSDYEFTYRSHKKGIKIICPDNLNVFVNDELSGIHKTKRLNLSNFMKTVFSVRYSSNPIYFTSFVILCCPIRWMSRNLFRVWKGFFKQLIKSIQHSLFTRD